MEWNSRGGVMDGKWTHWSVTGLIQEEHHFSQYGRGESKDGYE